MQGFESLQGQSVIRLFKNVVAHFIFPHKIIDLVGGVYWATGSDKSGSYKNPKIERGIKIKQPIYDKEVLWLSFLK